jgi:hypothetical protein
VELCSQHGEKLLHALCREIARDPFGEPHAYGERVLAAIETFAEGHPPQESSPLWGWASRMERLRAGLYPAAPPRTIPSWVYFAEREEVVKIGVSGNVQERLKALEAGGQMLAGMTAGPLRLLGTMPGGYSEERALHHRFSHLRVDPKREWFLLDGDLAEFVGSLKSVGSAP